MSLPVINTNQMKLKAHLHIMRSNTGCCHWNLPPPPPPALAYTSVVMRKRFKETLGKRMFVLPMVYGARLQMKMIAIYFEICSLILMDFLSK